MTERVDLLELAQQDQARKWSLFVGDISGGRAVIEEQERIGVKKSIEEIFLRIGEIEQQQRWNAGNTINRQENNGIVDGVEAALNEREARLINMIDSQGKDIAMDFSELDKKV